MNDDKKQKLRPLVYIAGPITKGDLYHNVAQADEAFEALARAGIAPVNPMWSVFAGGIQPAHVLVGNAKVYGGRATANSFLRLEHQDWLGTDLPVVARSDAVLRLPGESKGADMETACAAEHGVPVFTDIPSLVADLKERGLL